MAPIYRTGLLLAGIWLLGMAAHAQPAILADAPLSDRKVSYKIDARLDPETRAVQGQQRLTWRNPSDDAISELQFHLYLNAFRDRNSTFMRESGGSHRGNSVDDDGGWGGIEISRLTLMREQEADATPIAGLQDIDLTDQMRFIQPDDGNLDDRTVMAVTLPQPLLPGETVTLDIDFDSQLPRIFARTGWEEKADGSPFFMVAQWFPKIGVYEVPGQRYVPEDAPSGQWNVHQFHATTEFYADFGTYDVNITVPENYTVGASGVRVDESIEAGERTLTYRAEDVHDFAWTASSEFLTYTDKWRDVDLRLLIQPEHKGQVDRHFDSAKHALERFDRWVGPYPYTTLTLVDGIGGSNGMEYPTLITCGTFYGAPDWMRQLELVTIHEFGHQYFYGMLASNEFEESWLDEGINSYIEAKVMDEAYGPGSVVDLNVPRMSDGDMHRMMYQNFQPGVGRIFEYAWQMDPDHYAKLSYSKPVVVLTSLENYLGWDTMQEVMRTYYQRWRFRHPTTHDFIDVAEDVSGQDLSWFFDQFIFGTEVVDYGIDEPQITQEGDAYRSEVTARQLENGAYPQVLEVRFADGEVRRVDWDGFGGEHTFSFSGDHPIVEAYLDPDDHIWLDIDRGNNRRLVDPETTFARKQQFAATHWLQQLFALLGGIF